MKEREKGGTDRLRRQLIDLIVSSRSPRFKRTRGSIGRAEIDLSVWIRLFFEQRAQACDFGFKDFRAFGRLLGAFGRLPGSFDRS